MNIEKKMYSDGTAACGLKPLPDISPRQQDLQLAMKCLGDIEIMYGRNGSSIMLRGLIEKLAL